MQLRVARNLIEARIDLELASLVVASDMELNWWSCGGGDVPPQLNLRLILILTSGGKLAQPVASRVATESFQEFNRRQNASSSSFSCRR